MILAQEDYKVKLAPRARVVVMALPEETGHQAVLAPRVTKATKAIKALLVYREEKVLVAHLDEMDPQALMEPKVNLDLEVTVVHQDHRRHLGLLDPPVLKANVVHQGVMDLPDLLDEMAFKVLKGKLVPLDSLEHLAPLESRENQAATGLPELTAVTGQRDEKANPAEMVKVVAMVCQDKPECRELRENQDNVVSMDVMVRPEVTVHKAHPDEQACPGPRVNLAQTEVQEETVPADVRDHLVQYDKILTNV